MLGRLRTYRQVGAEVRAEFADRPLHWRPEAGYPDRYPLRIQRLHQQKLLRRSRDRSSRTETSRAPPCSTRIRTQTPVSAFLQTTVHVAQGHDCYAGSEARALQALASDHGLDRGRRRGGGGGAVSFRPQPGVRCSRGFQRRPCSRSRSARRTCCRACRLPTPASSGRRSTAVITEGLTTHVLREAIAPFPSPEEIGDNFQIGLRSTAIRGVTLDMAVFHNSHRELPGQGCWHRCVRQQRLPHA